MYSNKSKYANFYSIQSGRHIVETKGHYKIVIDAFDDKGIRDYKGKFNFYHQF